MGIQDIIDKTTAIVVVAGLLTEKEKREVIKIINQQTVVHLLVIFNPNDNIEVTNRLASLLSSINVQPLKHIVTAYTVRVKTEVNQLFENYKKVWLFNRSLLHFEN